jgi:hypothetical protein
MSCGYKSRATATVSLAHLRMSACAVKRAVSVTYQILPVTPQALPPVAFAASGELGDPLRQFVSDDFQRVGEILEDFLIAVAYTICRPFHNALL